MDKTKINIFVLKNDLLNILKKSNIFIKLYNSDENSMKPAVFLDRDGVINVDKGYINKISEFEWVDGSKEAIKYIREKGYLVFVVTNQSGIARGYFSAQDVLDLHQYINEQLQEFGTCIDDFFFSPYHPDFKDKFSELSHLRKPNTGMLEQAEKKWSFQKNNSIMIGDKMSDVICAERFGIKGYQYKSGNLFNFVRSISLS